MIPDGHIQIFKVAVSAQDHDFDFGVVFAEPLHQLHAVHAGHPDIGKNYIWANGIQLFQNFLSTCTERTNFIAPFLSGKTVRNAVADALLIICDDQTIHEIPPRVLFCVSLSFYYRCRGLLVSIGGICCTLLIFARKIELYNSSPVVPFGGLMDVLDEHMSAIKIVYPKEYELVMRKISKLTEL